jgi:hypothetical protein
MKMGIIQLEPTNLPPEVQSLLDRVPLEYMRDLALDLAWAAMIAPRRPDALHQVVAEWEATLEEIELAGDDLSEVLRARKEAQAGVGMTLDELHAYLTSDSTL